MHMDFLFQMNGNNKIIIFSDLNFLCLFFPSLS